MNPRRTPAFAKLLGKIRSMMVVSHDGGPLRSWDTAASREIQLEFEFSSRSGRLPADGKFTLPFSPR